MNKKRMASKAFLIAGKTIELTDCRFKGMRSENIAEAVAYYHKSIQLLLQLNNIIRTPANIFGMNGKVDKRRYRRYITKHRPAVIVFPQMRHY